MATPPSSIPRPVVSPIFTEPVQLPDGSKLDALPFTGYYAVANPDGLDPGNYIVEFQRGTIGDTIIAKQVATNLDGAAELVRTHTPYTGWGDWVSRASDTGASTPTVASYVDISGAGLDAPVTRPTGMFLAGTPARFTSVQAGADALPGWVSRHNTRDPFMPMMGYSRSAWAQASAGNTAYMVFGLYNGLTSSGPATFRQPDASSLFNSLPIVLHPTNGSSDSSGGWYTQGSDANWLVANGSNIGGFFFQTIFGLDTIQSGTRAFFGMGPGGRSPDGHEPSTQPNLVGVGWDSTDTSMQFFCNDGTGNCTKTPISATDFPIQAGAIYELTIFNSRVDANFIVYLRRIDVHKEASATLSSNIPAAGTGLSPQCNINTGPAGSVASKIVSTGFFITAPMPGSMA